MHADRLIPFLDERKNGKTVFRFASNPRGAKLPEPGTLIRVWIPRFSFPLIDLHPRLPVGLPYNTVNIVIIALLLLQAVLLSLNTRRRERKNAGRYSNRPDRGHFPESNLNVIESIISIADGQTVPYGQEPFVPVNYNTPSLSIQLITTHRFLTSASDHVGRAE